MPALELQPLLKKTLFQVKRKADGLTYALKRVDLSGLGPKELANAFNEIRMLASFCHPRLVAVYETWIGEAHVVVAPI